MKLRCTFRINEDGTVDAEFHRKDIRSPQIDELCGYLGYALMFAHEMSGVQTAFEVMQSIVMSKREASKGLTASDFESATGSSQETAPPERPDDPAVPSPAPESVDLASSSGA